MLGLVDGVEGFNVDAGVDVDEDFDVDGDFEGRAIEVFLVDVEGKCCGVELALDAETGTLVGDMVLSVLPKPPLLRVVDVRVDETLIVEGGDGRIRSCAMRSLLVIV